MPAWAPANHMARTLPARESHDAADLRHGPSLLGVGPAILAMIGLSFAASQAAAQSGALDGALELVDPVMLRVCADPRNLPFSNEAGEGFENVLAERLAKWTGRSGVSYTFFPQAIGFIRNTLGANRCDVIMGAAQGQELIQNTNAYYRTAYVLAVPKGSALDGVTTLDDPRLQGKRIGVVAGTPPATTLAVNGLIRRAKPYALMVDTRNSSPVADMFADLASGEIDAALAWGPMAGYYAAHADQPVVLAPLVHETSGPRMIYRITMGVRPTDSVWKHQLNDAIKAHQPEIDALLASYGVPLLDEQDHPITVDPGGGAVESGDKQGAVTPAEPNGYRMDAYREPVPATLAGAQVLDTEAAKALWQKQGAVFVDVLPTPKRPDNLPAETYWRAPPRTDLPGSIWLADTGYGALSPEALAYFKSGIAAAAKPDALLVFYCKRNCWMSWNAARRALDEGFAPVAWYPDGTDGWQEAGLPLEPRTSQPETR